MQRPVMNPNLFDDEAASASPLSKRRRLLKLVRSAVWRACRLTIGFLLYDPFQRLAGFRVEEGTPTSRFIRGLMYRLAFVPILIAMAACGIVWVATHPRSVTIETDPAAQGIYYEPVTFLSSDQTRLEGWLVPVLDAKRVLEQQEKALRKKHPAVVLVHDFGQRREQMIPLIKPLHDAGYVVLAINLRGGGPAPTRGETFGLRESNDVRCAVEMLRRRPFVDPIHVGLVGCGTGANAVLLAAKNDAQISAVVAERPMQNTRELVQSRIMPQNALLRWLAPLCKWTFEISYGVDVEDLEASSFRQVLASRPILLVDSPSAVRSDPSDARVIEQVKSYLIQTMPETDAVAGVSAK